MLQVGVRLDTFFRWCYYPARYFGVVKGTFVSWSTRSLPRSAVRCPSRRTVDRAWVGRVRPFQEALPELDWRPQRSVLTRQGLALVGFLLPTSQGENRCRARKRRGRERRNGASAVRPVLDH